MNNVNLGKIALWSVAAAASIGIGAAAIGNSEPDYAPIAPAAIEVPATYPSGSAVLEAQAAAAIDRPSAVPAVEPSPAPREPETDSLSNDRYYTNIDGESVHAPAYTESSCSAVGASAECRDGSCSFSQNRRGTCSHHGGVAEWL